MDYDNDKRPAMTPTAPRCPTNHEMVEHNMTSHTLHPRSVEQLEGLRRAAKLFAHTVVDLCPDSRERSLAITGAEQALMWAVAAIARNRIL